MNLKCGSHDLMTEHDQQLGGIYVRQITVIEMGKAIY